jgi:hypothetical protein
LNKENISQIQKRLAQAVAADPNYRAKRLYSLVYHPDWLAYALERVLQNQGSQTAGIDGITAQQLRKEEDKQQFLNELAELLAVDMIPPVWVPPVEGRELRALISHRHRLISQQTQIKNRLRSVLHRPQIVPPGGKLFSQNNRAWWHTLKLNPSEALRVKSHKILPLPRLHPRFARSQARS